MSRACVIALAGSGSHSGKTSLASAIVRACVSAAKRVAALKIATSTPDHRCERTGHACTCLSFEGQARLIVEAEILDRPGKDTHEFRLAGAHPVAFLQTSRDVVSQSVPVTLRDALFDGSDVLVVEGSEPIRQRLVDLSILVVRADGREPKPGTEALAPRVDWVVLATLDGVRPDASIVDRFSRLAARAPLLWTVGAPLPRELRASLADTLASGRRI